MKLKGQWGKLLSNELNKSYMQELLSHIEMELLHLVTVGGHLVIHKGMTLIHLKLILQSVMLNQMKRVISSLRTFSQS